MIVHACLRSPRQENSYEVQESLVYQANTRLGGLQGETLYPANTQTKGLKQRTWLEERVGVCFKYCPAIERGRQAESFWNTVVKKKKKTKLKQER